MDSKTSTPIILDQPLSRGKKEVSLSAFSYLFSELVSHCQSRVKINQLEKKLSEAGYGIGIRVLELVSQREKSRKEKNIITMLQFIHSTIWKSLFGKVADGLEKSTDKENEYYIYDREPITNKYIFVPRDLGSLNVAAFIAGIVEGILTAAHFTAEVTAHHIPATASSTSSSSSNSGQPSSQSSQLSTKTVYVIKFTPDVVKRELSLTS